MAIILADPASGGEMATHFGYTKGLRERERTSGLVVTKRMRGAAKATASQAEEVKF